MRLKEKGMSNEAIDAIGQGNLIQAIKMTRTKTGLGLKESKELVEVCIENDPLLKEKYLTKRMSDGLSQERILQITLIAIVAIIGYLVFSGKF